MDKPSSIEEAVDEAVGLFFDADKAVANTSLTRGSLIRAMRFAMHHGLTEKNIKLRGEQEIRLALFIGTMLDSRLIMQAKQKQDIDNQTKNEEKQNGKENT